MENADSGLGNPASAVGQVVQHLAGVIGDQMDRNAFFQVLTEQLRTFFHYDRCCINLYDAEREFLNLFTAADGTVVESLANTRVARNTVAGLAIASKKPVLINDLAAQNLGDGPMPLSSVGLNATIALPLIINREVIATLHVSFVRQPGNVVEILRFLIGLCPVVTTFLYAVLADERDNKSRATLAPNDAELASRLLKTPSMSRVMGIANQVAKLNIPVLITGETGTGKSVLAHWLHQHSPRHEENFVKVNCPSIAPSLFESEMFGHARGAFTGATTKRIGRVELAQHGTLFLDEIGELAPEMQSKLLQVLEENSFERVGETTSVEVDIRLIAATNIDPELAMREGRLRPDLYYRLGSVILPMPPLRTRKNDIPLFTEYFVHQFAKQHEITPPHLAPSVLQALQGRALRFAKEFPRGANVNFYDITGEDEVTGLTYERGVEDFTLACGTGTASMVAFLTECGEVRGRNVRVSVPGGVLIIDIERTSDGTVRPYLTGLTNIVAEGRVRDEELQLTIDERCVNLHRNEK